MEANSASALSSPLPFDPKSDLKLDKYGGGSFLQSQPSSPRTSEDFENGGEESSAATLLKTTDNVEIIRKASTLRLLLLTISNFGIQGVWSLLFSYGTVYLQTLGFSSTLTAIVWLAGPLSGAFFQPFVGALSDRCKSRFGRRKPYILGGAIATIVCLLGLASVEGAVCHLGFKKRGIESREYKITIRTMAVFWVYTLNMAIQPLQAGVRALIVETCPSNQQVEASAWVARFNNLGSMFTFFLGSQCLPAWLGDSQFMALSLLTSTILLLVVSVSLIASEKEKAHPESAKTEELPSETSVLKTLISSARNMPPRSWLVCKVQFFAWLGWFPFLYYNTAYVGKLSMSLISKDSLPDSHESASAVAARIGSFASFLFATISLLSILALPILARLFKPVTLPILWKVSHLMFAGAMACTYFVHSVTAGTALVAVVGTSWALTQWIPYAIIGEEISSLNEVDAEDVWDESTFESRHRKPALGATFGLHNSFIAAPQILAALACSVLFKALEPLHVNDNYGWALRFAGLAGLAAAWMSWGLR